MQSVLITGTSKGIGYETALAFARAGYRVHATMRDPSNSPALAETAVKEKLSITIAMMDVDDDESVKAGIARIQAQHGPVDVLVNNAGVERMGSVEELSIDDFRATMETNYFGVLRCIKPWCRRCESAGAGQSSTSARWREPFATLRRHRIAHRSGRSKR